MTAAFVLGSMLAGAAAQPAMPLQFECQLSLMTPQRTLTTPTPVTIRFAVVGRELREIHVVDQGGILYPGGNLRIVTRSNVVSLETTPMPAERPGVWTGRVERNMYRLKLASQPIAEAAEIGLGRIQSAETGEFNLLWNAAHQAEGSPAPLRGSGIGTCTPADTKDDQ